MSQFEKRSNTEILLKNQNIIFNRIAGQEDNWYLPKSRNFKNKLGPGVKNGSSDHVNRMFPKHKVISEGKTL